MLWCMCVWGGGGVRVWVGGGGAGVRVMFGGSNTNYRVF